MKKSRITSSYGSYHGNVRSHVFHASGCQHYNCKNCIKQFNSITEAKQSLRTSVFSRYVVDSRICNRLVFCGFGGGFRLGYFLVFLTLRPSPWSVCPRTLSVWGLPLRVSAASSLISPLATLFSISSCALLTSKL